MAQVYRLTNIAVKPRGAATAELMEDGVIVAKLERPAPKWANHKPSMTVTKFYSVGAETRFNKQRGNAPTEQVLDGLALCYPKLNGVGK